LPRIAFVNLGLLFLLVSCKPAAQQMQSRPAPTSVTVDSSTTAVKPGDVCPPPDSASAPVSAAIPSDTTRPKKKTGPVDTAKKSMTLPVTPETSAAKPEVVAAPAKAAGLPRIWDFGSENCIPCKFMYEVLTPMMKEYAGKVDIRIINVYQEQALSSQYRIQIIPTQVFMDASGKELYRHVGAYPRDSILLKFKEYGFVSAR